MARFNLEIAAQDMWDACGMDAERIARESAEASEKRGDTKLAKQWTDIAQAVRFHIGPSPHPKRPYGKMRPRVGDFRRSAPKVNLRQLMLEIEPTEIGSPTT